MEIDPEVHPERGAGVVLLTALRETSAALDRATLRDEQGRVTGWATCDGLTPAELAEVVRLESLLEGRLAGLRLHVVAAAEDSQARLATGAADTPAWAAAAGNRPRSWGALGLARSLEDKYAAVRAALATGRIGEDHARIIVKACESVDETLARLRREATARGLDPDEVAALVPTVSARELRDCEEALVDKATRMPPDRLRKAAVRVLAPLKKRVQVTLPDTACAGPDADTVEVDLADVVADDRLTRAERYAEQWASLELAPSQSGTWVGRFEISEFHAHLLKNWLEHHSSPRRRARRADGTTTTDPTVPDPFGTGVSRRYAEWMGDAFCELIEHLPTAVDTREGAEELVKARFGTNGVTMVVHVDEQTLRSGIGTATLASGAEITAAQARRLACEAGILPLVLSGDSVPLDLGRSQRLFTRHQAFALSATHDSCAAEGCERPFAWCELHHLQPWSAGGATDLDNAVPLCAHHHRRIHDALYRWRRGPDGQITFEHRWPSRRRTTTLAA